MTGWIDLHQHLLWGMDDGPESFSGSVDMLQLAAQQGVGCIVATPHFHPGMEAFNLQQYQASLTQLQAWVQQAGLPLRIIGGAELLYSSMLPQMLRKQQIPTLGDSWHVLVEFFPGESYHAICHAARSIGNAGYSMVLAHAERYRCLRWGDRLARLRSDYHVQIQINAPTLLRPGNPFTAHWLNRIMHEGLVDLVASDAHNTGSRPCCMGDCARLLAQQYGEDVVRRLMIETPLSILREKSVHIPT